jgi:hypothetical protein
MSHAVLAKNAAHRAPHDQCGGLLAHEKGRSPKVSCTRPVRAA